MKLFAHFKFTFCTLACSPSSNRCMDPVMRAGNSSIFWPSSIGGTELDSGETDCHVSH